MGTPISNLPERRKKTDPVMVGVDAQLARLLPFIFAPKEASIGKPRVDSWIAHHADGQTCRASISVMGTFNGDDDLRSLLVLFKMAQDATPNEDDTIDFSIKQHARLGNRGWRGKGGKHKADPKKGDGGTATIDDTVSSLLRLRGIMFMPSRIYSDEEGRRIEISEPITFLDKLRLVRRTVKDPETGDEYTDAMASRFRFNEYIRAQLATAPLKPIVFDTAMALPRNHPYVLRAYLTFDRNLSPKNATHYEWSATALLDELGLTLTDRSPSARRRFLDGLIKHLNGKDISRGVLHFERRPTEDGKDCKLILTRTARRPRVRQLSLPLSDDQRTPGRSMSAYYAEHRANVHPEPVGDCDQCKAATSLLNLGILKRTAAPEQPAPIDTEASPSPVPPNKVGDTPHTATDPAATMLPEAQQPPVANPETVPELESLLIAEVVAPSAPDQSGDTTPRARPPGVAPGEAPPA